MQQNHIQRGCDLVSRFYDHGLQLLKVPGDVRTVISSSGILNDCPRKHSGPTSWTRHIVDYGYRLLPERNRPAYEPLIRPSRSTLIRKSRFSTWLLAELPDLVRMDWNWPRCRDCNADQRRYRFKFAARKIVTTSQAI